MAGGSNQVPLLLLLAVSLIICLSGVVNAQGRKDKLKAVCDKIGSFVKRERCDLIGNDAALIAINLRIGAVHVALKLERDGRRRVNRRTDLMPVNDTDTEENSRRKRDAEDDVNTEGKENRRNTRFEKLERLAQAIPKCLKVDEHLIKVCKKARDAGYHCGRVMTFIPLGVMLLGENSEEIDVDNIISPLIAKRKVKAGKVECTNQAMLQFNGEDPFPVNQVNLEYSTRRRGANVTMDAELNFFQKTESINGKDFPAGTMKTDFKIAIKCPDDDTDSKCNQIKAVKFYMLINMGVKRRGIYRCQNRTCNVPFDKEAVVEIDRKYMLDGVENEVAADDLTYDDENLFTITFNTPMNGKKERIVKYDPTMAASVELYTGDDDDENILIGVYSTATRRSVFYPMVICTLLFNVLV